MDPLPVHPLVDRLAAYAWRLLLIAAALVAVLWLLREMWVVVLALVVSLFLCRLLVVPATWLRRLGAPPSLAALGALLGLFGLVSAAGWLVTPSVADEFESLGPTLEDAAGDVERWVVEDSPFDVDRADLEALRQDAGDAVSTALRSSGDSVVSGALIALEVVTGLLLAVVATFFFLKDGPILQRWALARFPSDRRPLVARLAARAWSVLGGYLRGAALLGLVEGSAIGTALLLVGADLLIPVAILTFAAAFVPMVGAIVAGVVASLVALATAGLGGALVVAIVALAVQQLDNDLLAPVIYGRALALHPLVVLFAVITGGALFGLAGTVLAVPATAVAIAVAVEARAAGREARRDAEAA